jgi:hypothetical protein
MGLTEKLRVILVAVAVKRILEEEGAAGAGVAVTT